jgi:cysteine synthase A
MPIAFDDILKTVGNTPLVRLNKLAPPQVNVFVKIEAFNPMGSVKDRLALGVIEDAERRGTLRPGQTVIEATSGNTGIGLAMVCAVKGYPLVVVMAENFSVERRKMMRFLGAKVVLTPAALRGTGMLAKAVELAQKHDWFLCRQFDNEANANMHSRTTAPEILRAFAGEELDYWVTGCGTGGTLKGVARVLKAERPETKIIVCEPDNSPTLGSGIAQPRRPDGTLDSHPSARPHLMQGWTPDFIPKLTEDAVSMKLVDAIVPINGADALRCARDLAAQEGIFTGISGGATLAGALKIAATARAGANIVCMLPDTGERYLTTPLFETVGVDMSPEEVEISESTPGARFGAAAPAPAPEPEKTPLTPQAPEPVAAEEIVDFVARVLDDAEQPVVLFALEWCEYCWAVRKLFAKCRIPFRSIDLDSTTYQRDDRGGQIRAVLHTRTGSKTIPQIFIGGQFIGGATETLDAFKQGKLQQLLTRYRVQYDSSVQLDPNSLLPGWVHPR